MKKILAVVCMSLMLILSACGGADSKISDYKNALKDNDLEKAVTALTSLSKEKLTDDQKSEIVKINDEFFESAIADLQKSAAADGIDISSFAILSEYAMAYAAVLDSEAASDSGSESSEVKEEAADENPLQPPFTLKAVWEELDNQKFGYGRREYYDISVNKNGTYKVVEIDSHNDSRSQGIWYSSKRDSITYEGKWTVDYRAVGEDLQKVYDLKRQNGATLLYIPEDGEYFWNVSDDFHHVADWQSVSNFNFSNAIKIAEYTTKNGSVVLIPEEERITKTPEPIVPKEMLGKKFKFEYEKDGTKYLIYLEVHEDAVYFKNHVGETVSTSNYSIYPLYMYLHNNPYPGDGVFSNGGKTITFPSPNEEYYKQAVFELVEE